MIGPSLPAPPARESARNTDPMGDLAAIAEGPDALAAGDRATDARAAVAARGFWYHTMELAPGVVTPGWFDLRPIVDRLPWPDVRGKRCLDVGPYDGFLSFELERRGAAEVVATDIGSPTEWDWPAAMRENGGRELAEIAGSDPGGGFRVARKVLGSSAKRVEVSVYDLAPETVGTFDVVVCGSLLLHLRDPVAALEAIRGVCTERFLSIETISPGLSLLSRRRPLAQQRGGVRCQWWIPNAAAHRRMLQSAGFAIERAPRPFAEPLGPAHPQHGRLLGSWRQRLPTRVLTLRSGIPHGAVLARPV
jgi:tRNA (mo5U34)-methyltransferase